MAILQNSIIPVTAAAAAPSAYTVDNSLKFNGGTHNYIKRTFGTSTNENTWTVSLWAKRAKLGAEQMLFHVGPISGGSDATPVYFGSNDTLGFYDNNDWHPFVTTQVFRDVGSWYHIVIAFSTAESGTDKVKLWVNGSQVTSFSTDNRASVTTNNSVNTSDEPHEFGAQSSSPSGTYGGYLADVHFIDGTAKQASDFAETDSNGQWVPKEYTGGSYGTNGFHLPFDNTAGATVFADSSTTGTTHTISANGDVTHTRAQKKIGDSSIYFDGTGDYLTTPAHADFDMADGDFTVECWVNTPVAGDPDYLFSQSHHEGGNSSFGSVGLVLLSGRIYFVGYNTTDGLLHPDVATTVDATISTDTWTHIAVVRDGDTLTMYKDGSEDGSATNSSVSLTAGSSFNSVAYPFTIGRAGDITTAYYYNGYIDDLRISKGIARASSTFASTSALEDDEYTSLLIHSNWNGGLGADASGNFNDFTATNLGSEDQMGDTPSAGKNYATFNPLVTSSTTTPTYSEGNLKIVLPDVNYWNWAGLSTIGFSSGKFFTEARVSQDVSASTNGFWSGLGLTTVAQTSSSTTNTLGDAANGIGWWGHGSSGGALADVGRIRNDSTDTDDADLKFTEGDIIGIGVDLDASTKVVRFFVNGVYKYAFDLPSAMEGKELFFCASRYSYTGSMTVWFNAGQDPTFNGEESPSTVYTDSEGTGEFYTNISSSATYPFKSLCTANLAAPGLNNAVDSEQAFEAVAWEGDATAKNIDVGSFTPDLVWAKNRDDAYHHGLFDSVRGANKVIKSSDDSAEATYSQELTAFISSPVNGFSIGTDDGHYVNVDGDSYVAWCWKAGTDITDESYNTAAGFSIRKYEGNDMGGYEVQSISHSLGTAPEMMIVKNRDDGSTDWMVYHKDLDSDNGSFLKLNETNEEESAWSSDAPWSISSTGAPTDSVFYVTSDSSMGQAESTNDSGSNYIAYLFRSVEGYSKVGSYDSNASSDGPFIYCGFRPAFVMIKHYAGTASSGDYWVMMDSSRDTYNVVGGTPGSGGWLAANNADDEYPSSAESAYPMLDFLSNGFKLRATGSNVNYSTNDYIFYAVADNPFKYANAR